MASSPENKRTAAHTEPEEQPSEAANPNGGQPTSLKRRLFRLAIILLSVYLGICLMLSLIQRKLIYVPKKSDTLTAAAVGMPEHRYHLIKLTVDDGLTLNGWHVLPHGRSALDEQERQWERQQQRPAILYFSGNAGHRGVRVDEFEMLTGLGADLYVFDYRGYGDNPGTPSEARLTDDAEAIWSFLTDEEQVSPDQILLLGESLGGGVAAALAARLAEENVQPGGLFLKTTFSSLVDTAGNLYPWLPVSLLMTERFESTDNVTELTCPVTVLHGTDDRIVPFSLAEKLFAAVPETSASGVPKQFIELPGTGHNDVMYVAEDSYRRAVIAMLQNIRTAN